MSHDFDVLTIMLMHEYVFVAAIKNTKKQKKKKDRKSKSKSMTQFHTAELELGKEEENPEEDTSKAADGGSKTGSRKDLKITFGAGGT